jgi:hypothetical protein
MGGQGSLAGRRPVNPPNARPPEGAMRVRDDRGLTLSPAPTVVDVVDPERGTSTDAANHRAAVIGGR